MNVPSCSQRSGASQSQSHKLGQAPLCYCEEVATLGKEPNSVEGALEENIAGVSSKV